jgi:hypothetical protein
LDMRKSKRRGARAVAVGTRRGAARRQLIRSAVPRLDDPISLVREAEHRFESELVTYLGTGQLGDRGGGMYSGLSVGIDILVGVASCRWGCRGGDHALENAVRRFANACLAAIKLGFAGYYDEALALVRVSAETANLLQLFVRKPGTLGDWEAATERGRRREFSPFSVRVALVDAGAEPIFPEGAYAALCDAGVHLSPTSSRRSHELENDNVFVGPMTSVPGLFMVWTELSIAVGGCLPVVLEVVKSPAEVRASADRVMEALTLAIGKGELRAGNYDAALEWYRLQGKGDRD